MRTDFALLLANVRYWATVAPTVRTQLARWELRARAISDPLLRGLAMRKLGEERFNVEAAATLATVAKRSHRRDTVEALVALQVAYDYLDLLGEQTLSDRPQEDRRLFDALAGVFALEQQPDPHYYPWHTRSSDGSYLEELFQTVRSALGRLPAGEAVRETALHTARRCAQAQALIHAAPSAGTVELQSWATREARGTCLQWQEFLAAATASVLTLHALIAAAADPATTCKDARRIEAAYLPICALTMLDSLVDHEHDLSTGQLNYLELYGSQELMAWRVAQLARDAEEKACTLPHAGRHIVTLLGVVSYYASTPTTGNEAALHVMRSVCEQLRPRITPTLALMRVWRMAKRTRHVGYANRASRGETRCIV